MPQLPNALVPDNEVAFEKSARRALCAPRDPGTAMALPLVRRDCEVRYGYHTLPTLQGWWQASAWHPRMREGATTRGLTKCMQAWASRMLTCLPVFTDSFLPSDTQRAEPRLRWQTGQCWPGSSSHTRGSQGDDRC